MTNEEIILTMARILWEVINENASIWNCIPDEDREALDRIVHGPTLERHYPERDQ